jgi:hypothetical protein
MLVVSESYQNYQIGAASNRSLSGVTVIWSAQARFAKMSLMYYIDKSSNVASMVPSPKPFFYCAEIFEQFKGTRNRNRVVIPARQAT